LIAVTGWGQEEDKKRSRDAGFDYHLTKPIDVLTLEQILAQLN
jgi:CheY-like chemotaxis protein